MLTKIKNDFLKITINTLGAEMLSIKTADATEHLHQPDSAWGSSSPILFPVCGAPKDGKITADGKDYPMSAHGFAKSSEFEISAQNETSITFLLKSDTATKKSYPYDFEFYVTYTLDRSSLDVCFNLINKTNDTIYFSFGSHEGYLCPDGLENYEIHLEKAESKKPFVYETRLVPEEYLSESGGHSVLCLSDALFENAITVIYEDIDSDFVILKNKKDGGEIKVDFKDTENLCIWTKPNSGFVCIEPWCGMADFGENHRDISEKRGIHALGAGLNFERHHTVTFAR